MNDQSSQHKTRVFLPIEDDREEHAYFKSEMFPREFREVLPGEITLEEKIVRLNRQHSDELTHGLGELGEQCASLMNENKLLREVLEFYAEKANYQRHEFSELDHNGEEQYRDDAAIAVDRGERARLAMEASRPTTSQQVPE